MTDICHRREGMSLVTLHTATAPAVRAAVKTVVSCKVSCRAPVGVLRNARCTGFSFPVTVQNATTETPVFCGL